MKLITVYLILLDIVFVSGHHAIKYLLSMESTKYQTYDYCGPEHLQSTTNAFMGQKAEKIESILHFCSHCKHYSLYNSKYLNTKVIDDNVEKVVSMVAKTERALDIICPGWDEEFRYKDVDATMKWIIDKRKVQVLPSCIELAKGLIVDYASKGNVEKTTLMSRVVEVLSSPKLRLGWAAVAADFNSQDECYLDSCFRVVNALTYFKPEICSHGPIGSFLADTCAYSCAKIESRLVETSLNDCCDGCMGEISRLNETEKDLIDIHPFKSWKDII